MTTKGVAKVKIDVRSIYNYAYGACAINSIFAFALMSVLCMMIHLLYKKLKRQKLARLSKSLKSAHKVVKDELSPGVDEMLAVCEELGFTKQNLMKLYEEYDARRRKVTTKYMRYEDADIKHIPIFKKFFEESHFIKGTGFRMHRLLHEQNTSMMAATYQSGKTVLAPAFK